jgi:hypothetical protein
MKLTPFRQGTAISLFLGSLLGGAAIAQGQTGTIIAGQTDARYQTDGQTQITGSAITNERTFYVGSGYYAGTNLSHYVAPFQLPNLGEGVFTEVRFFIQANDADTTWRIPVNLWTLPGARTSNATLSSDVRTADQNHNQRGNLVMESFLGSQTYGDTYRSTPPEGIESARLRAWFNDAYANGTNAGKHAFLRLSPRALTPAENSPLPETITSGFSICTADFVFGNAAIQPYLTYTFVPSSAGAPTIDSFTASSDRVFDGESVTLQWSVSGAETVYLDDGFGEFEVDAQDTYTFQPYFDSNLSLRAVNASGERIAMRTIEWKPLQAEIPGELYDARFSTDPSNGVVNASRSEDDFTDEQVFIGRAEGSSSVGHFVIPFRLPDLGPGSFGKANLHVLSMGVSGATPDANTNLFAIEGARSQPTTLNSDVCDGKQSPLTRGILVQPDYLNEQHSDPYTQVSTTEGAPQDILGEWLSDAYANGANGGKFVFLRLSPKSLNALTGAGFSVTTSDSPAAYDRPYLTYEFVPNAPQPPQITQFDSPNITIAPGWSTTISWNVSGADTVSIEPGIGPVGPQGSQAITPLQTTTYVLTTTNAAGTSTQSLTIGAGPMRYFRFIPVAARSSGRVSISEFQILDASGNRLSGATTGFTGNLNSASAANANDNSTSTYWDETLNHPLTLDFGSVRANAHSYRFATSGNANRDPLGWLVEGSPDGQQWVMLDQRSGYPTTNTRNTYITALALPYLGQSNANANPPYIASFSASKTLVEAGENITLSWSVLGSTSVTILPNIGSVASSGSTTVTVPANITYTLTATNSADNVSSQTTIATGTRYRYFRFVPTTFRSGPETGAVAISEFQILNQGTRVTGATATNPGGENFDGYGVPSQGNDGNLFTHWIDANKGTLVLDFGTERDANSYRIGLADSDLSWGDPTSWRIEASKTGSQWTVLDEQLNVEIPASGSARNQFLTSMMFTTTSTTPPPIVSFGANSTSINEGQSSTLQWNVTGATSVSINQGIDTVSTSGSRVVTPTTSTTYTLTADGAGGTTVTTAQIQVTPAPVISFSVSTQSILSGASATLSWNVTNATKVRIDQNIGYLAASGSMSVQPSADTTYTLTAEWAGGTRTATVAIEVNDPPPPPPPPALHPPFEVTSMNLDGTVCSMTWDSEPGAAYTIESSTDLVTWSVLVPHTPSQGESTTTSVDLSQTAHQGSPRLFMRVRAQ